MPRAASRRRDRDRDRDKRNTDQGSADRSAAARPKPGGATPEPDPFPPPLRPRKGLFLALLAFVLVWLAFLLVLYFTTIYPNRADDALR